MSSRWAIRPGWKKWWRRWAAGTELTGEAAALHFFFYGTLIAGSGNAAAQSTHARLRAIGPASVCGALWAIPDPVGWYPALMSGLGQVHGVLYVATEAFGAGDLARLDEWEDYRPAQPGDSLYLREEMVATDTAGGTITAQAYRYNQCLPTDACAIPEGDFRTWLAATGYPAYSG